MKELLKAADQLSIKKVPGIERMLEGEAPVNVAVLSGKFDVKGGRDAALGGVWNTAGMTMPEGKLAVAWTRMKGDGEKVPLKGLQPINPAVLAYVASDPTVAVGAGLTPEFDWSHIAGLAMLTGDFQTQAMMSVAMPYLAAIDGTVMLAASPADSQAFADIDPGNWNFVLLAHMPQDKIDKLLGTVRTMCFTAGIKPEVDAKTGIMSIRQYGMNLHLGNVDGYFAISNNPFSDTGDNSLAPQFTGKNGAARISLPSLAPLGPGLPAWGLNMEATVGDAEGNLVVSLPGSEDPCCSICFRSCYDRQNHPAARVAAGIQRQRERAARERVGDMAARRGDVRSPRGVSDRGRERYWQIEPVLVHIRGKDRL